MHAKKKNNSKCTAAIISFIWYIKKMKKIWLAVFVLSIVLSLYTVRVHAAENVFTGEQMNINKQSIADLNQTSVRFCNQWMDPGKFTPKLYMQSRPGQVQEICTVLFNNLGTGMNFYVWFTEATKNKHNEWLCDDDAYENEFSKFIRDNFVSETVNVTAHKQKQKMYTIGIPKTATGDIIWCLSYAIDGSYSKNTWDVFGIVVRKTAPIWITVTWEVYNYGRRDDIKYAYTDNKQTILKILVAVLAVRLVVTIVKTGKKKGNQHEKKQTSKK